MTCVGVRGVHAVAVAAVRAARHVPRLPAAAAPQPPRLLVLLVQLVDVILLHLTTSEINIFPHCLGKKLTDSWEMFACCWPAGYCCAPGPGSELAGHRSSGASVVPVVTRPS